MLAFVVGLKAEARLLEGRVFIGGGDAAGAARAAIEARHAGAAALVSFGLAGGLSPLLSAGDIVVPRQVIWRGRRFAADPDLSAALGGFSCDSILAAETVVGGAAAKARLWQDLAADAVDLESGAVADAASAADMPFAVLRAVCDPAWRTLPPAASSALDGFGSISLFRVLHSLAGQPSQMGGLLALARDARRARSALINRLATIRANQALDAWG
jgi:adenosylhomocysteine nucleosidase